MRGSWRLRWRAVGSKVRPRNTPHQTGTALSDPSSLSTEGWVTLAMPLHLARPQFPSL